MRDYFSYLHNLLPWYFVITVDNRGTDNVSVRVKSGKTHTGRKRPTMAIRLGFVIENFSVNLSSHVFYRDSHTNPYILLAFPHTELGAPVLGANGQLRIG